MSSKKAKKDDSIDFTIDGQKVQAREGWTILETARANHIDIPTLCYHPALHPWGSCRLCVVEIRQDGRTNVTASCLAKPAAGMEVLTRSERVENVRRWVLEMLLAECPASQEIRDLAARHGVTATRFAITDPAEECLKCGRCVAVCNEVVGVRALTFGSRGVKKKLETPYRVPNNMCIGCGCCVSVCPTGALQKRLDTVRGDISRRTGASFAH
jgi:bidirectional [NiFe] hydrogenase diaphorase subunit|uniref:2Fe-2S iron-sulfur cluster binding domain-containing protein n=1 Tax=Desulfobacca acetoxidans TaxID=60893 RepID=A0A7V6A354_9BACT